MFDISQFQGYKNSNQLGPGALAGISAGGNLLSTGLQFLLNRKIWKEQQEYNHPKNQIKRLHEAGINPNLMYAQGGTGLQSEAPLGNPVDQGKLGSESVAAFQAAQAMELQRSQVNATDAETELKGQQLENLKEVGIGLKWDNFVKANRAKFFWEEDPTKFGGGGYANNFAYQFGQEAETRGLDNVGKGLNNNILSEKSFQETIKSKYFEQDLVAKIASVETLTELYKANTDLERQKIKTEMKKLGLMNSQINSLDRMVQIAQQNADTNFTNAMTRQDSLSLDWANHDVYALNSAIQRRARQQDIHLKLNSEEWQMYRRISQPGWKAGRTDWRRGTHYKEIADLTFKVAQTSSYAKSLLGFK